ncbi:MAG: KpsF/GutQ family sugar-phosphate isomerase [Acidobacteriota bacterium]|nr:KpsF/GutQ family sugar-phosphate isomerase [Acidobacteriota bacterium]
MLTWQPMTQVTAEVRSQMQIPIKSQNEADVLSWGRQVIQLEAQALTQLAQRLDHSFNVAVERILACRGRIVTSGMGKAGLIAQKIAATFASTGTPSIFLHPAEAMHGDLGMVSPGDVALLFSNTGETEELIRLVPHLRQREVIRIAITGRRDSNLARASDVVLDIGVVEEACPLRLAPSSSTTALLAMGDALALTVLKARGFTEEDFGRLHPAGSLGRQLSRVEDVMRTGERCPCVEPSTPVREVVAQLSRARGGLACVVDAEGRLLGVFTDGDFRRCWAKDPFIGERPVQQVMTRGGLWVSCGTLVRDATALMAERHVNALPVLNELGRVVGLVDIQDLV